MASDVLPGIDDSLAVVHYLERSFEQVVHFVYSAHTNGRANPAVRLRGFPRSQTFVLALAVRWAVGAKPIVPGFQHPKVVPCDGLQDDRPPIPWSIVTNCQ